MSERWNTLAWYWKLAILIVGLWLLANVVLATAKADVYDDQLANASVEETTDTSNLILAPAISSILSGSIPAGCHGRVYRTKRIYLRLTNFTIGWRRTAIDRWCNNSRGQIYDWGYATGDDGKYAIAPYCWYDTTYGKVWWTVSKSEAKVWNQGTLKVCGRISLGITVNPRIYFHSATLSRPYRYWNYGGTTIYH